jgi:hypothetical protein
MKAILKIVLLAGPLLALPTQAFAWGSCGPQGCTSCHWGLCGLNPFNFHGCLAGPWYSYWPYEAHFVAAAPVACNYPYWAGAAGAMPYFGDMTAVPPAVGSMGHYGAYAGGMGYGGNAGFSSAPTPSWPTAAGAPNGYPLMGSTMQGSPYGPGGY